MGNSIALKVSDVAERLQIDPRTVRMHRKTWLEYVEATPKEQPRYWFRVGTQWRIWDTELAAWSQAMETLAG